MCPRRSSDAPQKADAGLCGLLSVKAVALQEKAPSLPAPAAAAFIPARSRSKPCSDPSFSGGGGAGGGSTCGRSLRAALSFAHRSHSSGPTVSSGLLDSKTVDPLELGRPIEAPLPQLLLASQPPLLKHPGDGFATEQSQLFPLEVPKAAAGRPPLPPAWGAGTLHATCTHGRVGDLPPPLPQPMARSTGVDATTGASLEELAGNGSLESTVEMESEGNHAEASEDDESDGDEEEEDGKSDDELGSVNGDRSDDDVVIIATSLRGGDDDNAQPEQVEEMSACDGELGDTADESLLAGGWGVGAEALNLTLEGPSILSDTGYEDFAKDEDVDDEDTGRQKECDKLPDDQKAGDEVLTKSKKKKNKKKKAKKKRRSTKVLMEEELPLPKRPPVPRFQHPPNHVAKGAGLELTTTSAPVASRAMVIRSKDLSKHLVLGRFSKRTTLANLMNNSGAHEAPANSQGGEATADIANEAATTTSHEAKVWVPPKRKQRRAKSCDDTPSAAALATNDGAHGATNSTSRGRSLGPPGSDGSKTLTVVGLQKPRATAHAAAHTRALSLAAAAAERDRRRQEESDDSNLGALYFTFSSMKDENNKKVHLHNRDKVVRILHELSTKVAHPVCRHFGLRYNFFSEHHCQAKKAGVTMKEPLILRKKSEDGETTVEEKRFLVTIRLRVRVHPTKGDPQTDFISKGTQLAVLLHELCHLRHMNHGKDFMFFLRDIFAHATKLGIFNPKEMSNEIPSPWPWENEIFRSGGEVGDEELLRLFAEHRAAQKAKEAAAASAEAGPSAEPTPPTGDLALAEPAVSASSADLEQARPEVAPAEPSHAQKLQMQAVPEGGPVGESTPDSVGDPPPDPFQPEVASNAVATDAVFAGGALGTKDGAIVVGLPNAAGDGMVEMPLASLSLVSAFRRGSCCAEGDGCEDLACAATAAYPGGLEHDGDAEDADGASLAGFDAEPWEVPHPLSRARSTSSRSLARRSPPRSAGSRVSSRAQLPPISASVSEPPPVLSGAVPPPPLPLRQPPPPPAVVVERRPRSRPPRSPPLPPTAAVSRSPPTTVQAPLPMPVVPERSRSASVPRVPVLPPVVC